MSSILFKRFFEIRLLHEYYFMQTEGMSIFDKKRDEWDVVLTEKIINKRYDITNDLLIEPAENSKKQLIDYHIRFVRKPTGFILGIEVQADQITPKIAFDKPVVFQFLVKIKNPDFITFTNELSGHTSYYFSNRSSQLSRSRNAPMLSNTIVNFTKNKTYKMGELAQKAGKLQIARKTTNSANASDWMPLSTQSGQYTYVNAQDVCQFKQKNLQYQAPELIEKITARLFADDNSSKPQKTIDLTVKPPAQTVSLDFSEDDKKNKIADGPYLLSISYNGKPEESEMIYFSDTLAVIRPYAFIEIRTDAEGTFNVLTTDGKLVRDKVTGKHPVFDILFKSRATYWRYRSSSRKKLTKPNGYDFLVEKDPDLITVDPRVLSAEASSFQRINNNVTTSVFLPSPDVTTIQQGDDVFYSDVFVPKV